MCFLHSHHHLITWHKILFTVLNDLEFEDGLAGEVTFERTLEIYFSIDKPNCVLFCQPQGIIGIVSFIN